MVVKSSRAGVALMTALARISKASRSLAKGPATGVIDLSPGLAQPA